MKFSDDSKNNDSEEMVKRKNSIKEQLMLKQVQSDPVEESSEEAKEEAKEMIVDSLDEIDEC